MEHPLVQQIIELFDGVLVDEYGWRHYKVKGKNYDSSKEIMHDVQEWIDSKDAEFFRRGIYMLPERWRKVVESDGEYFT